MVDTHMPPRTLRELFVWPTLIVGGLMIFLWLGLASIVVTTIVGASGDPTFWDSVAFIMWEFSLVLLVVGMFCTAVTLGTYGITTAVRRTRAARALSA